MAARAFVAWVHPVAASLAADRRRLIDFARSAPPGLWEQPSEVEGWACRDILAHLAGGNDQMVQLLLRSAVSGEPVDPALLSPDTDAENALGVAERGAWSIDRLIDELERGGEEVQELLSRLTDADEQRRWSGFSISLGEFLRLVDEERHDLLHLEQLQQSLDRLGTG
jgi:hypothetical protein